MIDNWQNVWSRPEGQDPALLVGNGFSQNISGYFSYRSLYDEACKENHLGSELISKFDELNTSNFELVLETLRSDEADKLRTALWRTIKDVHVERSAFTQEELEHIASLLKGYSAVFTLNYDLILYWAVNQAQGGFDDRFRSGGEFAPNSTMATNTTPLLFLHGALHLHRNLNNQTKKRIWNNDSNILKQLASENAKPHVVTEGTSKRKLEVINISSYLKYALDQLKTHSGSVVVFGHSLSEQDRHIVKAINAHPNSCPVAVSVYDTTATSQDDIRATFPNRDVLFFDSKTHPLGDPDLATWAIHPS